MTSRIRLSMLTQIIGVAVLATLPILLITASAKAQTETNRLVVEIKTLNLQSMQDYLANDDEDVEPEVEETPVIESVPVPTPAPAPKIVAPKKTTSYPYPPKVAPEERVYMHEPEIRDYICPKIGQSQCNIFIAVLKAENGTHECTRDNRGVNKNGSLDVGLAQINWNANYHPPYTVEQLRDCKFNLDIALQKYKTRGFQPWYAYTKGAYKKFLKPSVN